jgi:putative transposase
MSPLVRRTLAPRGKTPVLKINGSHHDRVSVTAALTISPRRGRLGLYWQSYPKEFVNSARAAEFLRYLLRRVPGALTVVWDGGPMHKGDPIREVLAEHPRLRLERLPPYAPELNPVEYLWEHLKHGKLPNFTPDDVFQLDAVLQRHLKRAKRDHNRLRGFYNHSHLPFY